MDKLALERRAVILAVQGRGSLRRRLLALGFTPGAEVMARKTAPLGDPLQLCLRGYELAIRREDAAYIKVTFKKDEERERSMPTPSRGKLFKKG